MNNPKKRCEEIINYLIKSNPNVFKDINTKRLAKINCVSRSYLSRTFKKCMGISLKEFIMRIKLSKCALLMLKKRHLKVFQIAEYFGFGNSDYFIIKFKKFFLITPGKFKKLAKK